MSILCTWLGRLLNTGHGATAWSWLLYQRELLISPDVERSSWCESDSLHNLGPCKYHEAQRPCKQESGHVKLIGEKKVVTDREDKA